LLANSSVNLVGYGMGAAVVFYCLINLVYEGGYAARGIVENAILIGAPVENTAQLWDDIRKIVSGRVVNVYSERDYILAIMSRLKNWTLGVAGLQPIHSEVLYVNQASEGKDEINIETEYKDGLKTCDGITYIDKRIEGNFSEYSSRAMISEEDIGDIMKVGRTIENINVSDLIISQSEYPKHLHQIMQMIYNNSEM
jgi:Protein of unknown function (DUF726)